MNDRYCEVTVEGGLDLVKGFVAGFLEGRGISGDVFFGSDYQIERGSPAGLLMRLTGIRGETCTLVVGAGLHELLAAALERRRGIVPLRILKVRPVASAAFDVSFRTYSRAVGAEIRELFGSLPAGVSHGEGFEMQEKVTPEGKGVEAYAPLHEYELRGRGRIEGDVRGVFGLYHRLERFEVVERGDMELTCGEDQ